LSRYLYYYMKRAGPTSHYKNGLWMMVWIYTLRDMCLALITEIPVLGERSKLLAGVWAALRTVIQECVHAVSERHRATG